ncbi:uncharacterized protein LOC118414227 isoform X3 [Branchiostoma floridae]|uniref:Uncharacterized protein LOC118414227 isoform X3 n=1 Tax=Branchiostoma floridae TaxID=7739 RepID=A0A9J7MN12_BRAFL|nr:uncharacterized protein LOC118414227 isoform X3 [Branchiostoma floridae]
MGKGDQIFTFQPTPRCLLLLLKQMDRMLKQSDDNPHIFCANWCTCHQVIQNSLRRDTCTATVQESLYVLHKLFCKKKEDASPFNRQAEAAEDDLVRTSFHNAELQMLLTDEKLQADDAKVQHERELSQAHADLEMAICDLQEEKNRSAQKHILIDDLKAQVAILKTGGSRFSSRYEARAHISPEEAEAMAYRIAELEVVLEEQRNEHTKLTAQLQQSKEKSLPAYTEQQDHSFLPECFLARSASPIDEEEMLPADKEHKEDSFLPECFLAHCPSSIDEEEMLPADNEHKEDSFLPECFLAHCPSPIDEEEMLPADMEHKEDSFLPECFLARCPSPMDDDEENLTSDMNMDIAPLMEELLINSSSLLRADSVSALEQESQDILCLSELLSSTSAVSLTSLCNGSQEKSQDTKMVKSQASVNKETCSGLLQSMLQEAHQILSLSAKLATPSPHHDKTGPIKVQLGQVVKTELPTEATYRTTVEPCQGSCCYTTTYISSNKDITVYQQL